MREEDRPKDSARSKYADDGPATPTEERVSEAAPLSFMAAADQVQALTRLAPDAAATASIDGRAHAIAQLRKRRERTFLTDGAFTLDANALREELAFLRTVEAIRAKAAALGYGALAQSTPISPVPGGYVGRFAGNDIYASTR